MIYSYEDIENLSSDKHSIAIARLLPKFQKDRKNLKYHELDFICRSLDYLVDAGEPDKMAFNSFDYKECNDCTFRRLVVIYVNNLNFLLPVDKGTKFASKEEVERDKLKLLELLDEWKHTLINCRIKNPIFAEVKIELNKKLKILDDTFRRLGDGHFRYLYLRKQHILTSRYIYDIIYRYYLKSGRRWIILNRDAKTFVIGHYCFVHILYRHFIPSINGIDIEKSFHDEGYLDPFNLPHSLEEIIHLYLDIVPEAYFNQEWFIFSHKTKKCIVWWKYKRCDEINKEFGYEIRTCYPIVAQRDIDRFDSLNQRTTSEDFTFYY